MILLTQPSIVFAHLYLLSSHQPTLLSSYEIYFTHYTEILQLLRHCMSEDSLRDFLQVCLLQGYRLQLLTTIRFSKMLSDAPACDLLDLEDYLTIPVHRLLALYNSLHVCHLPIDFFHRVTHMLNFLKKLAKWTWEEQEQLPLLSLCSRCEEIIVIIKASKDDRPLGDKLFSSIRSLMKLQEIQATLVDSPVVRASPNLQFPSLLTLLPRIFSRNWGEAIFGTL